MIRKISLLGTAIAALALPARADEQTVKLIQLLIQKGILSPGQARDLLRETGAAGRRGRAVASAPEEEAPPAPPGQIRVTYVPQFIRKQIADQVRAEVMTEAQSEGWAAPETFPEWVKRIKVYGDLRFRYQGDIFDDGNYPNFANFASINGGSPYDINGAAGTGAPVPYLNTTENRNRFRVRARFGIDAALDDWISADIRVGTGQDNGPVSPNQTLGQPGDFGKYNLWLDRAYFRATPLPQLTVYAGRFNNPFLPSDLMFYPELGFDGIAAIGHYAINDAIGLFGTVGGFPLANTAFDFSTNNSVKYASRDSYLAGVQAGVRWHATSAVTGILGVGIFDFLGVQGAVSSPCTLLQPFSTTSPTYTCDTDNTRSLFNQFGNTVYAIRNIVPQPTNGTTPPDPQYFGLASKFNVLDIHPRVEIATYHPIDIAIEGEFIKNLAYNRDEILRHGPPYFGNPKLQNEVNTVGPQNNIGSNGLYQGGDTGYMAKVIVGSLEVKKRWEWNVSLAYRYLETDSTLDSIDDSDFHLGGTNARGYVVGGVLGVAPNTTLSVRWLSATQISGPPYGVNTIQVDLLSSF